MRTRGPSVEDLYSEARELDGFYVDNWRDEDLEWGEGSGEYKASNSFVWDVSPSRFDQSTEAPEEIVVLPDTYEAFVEGDGFLVRTPLYDDRDFEDAKEVLGDRNVVGNGGGGFRGVEDLDTPKDVMQLHQLADRLDIDVYAPSEWGYGLTRPEGLADQFIDGWRETAFQGVGNFVDEYTTDAVGRWSDEVIDEFADNGRRTAFVTYASNDGEYTEEDIEHIKDADEGDLSYHTPFTMNQVLGGNVLEAD